MVFYSRFFCIYADRHTTLYPAAILMMLARPLMRARQAPFLFFVFPGHLTIDMKNMLNVIHISHRHKRESHQAFLNISEVCHYTGPDGTHRQQYVHRLHTRKGVAAALYCYPTKGKRKSSSFLKFDPFARAAAASICVWKFPHIYCSNNQYRCCCCVFDDFNYWFFSTLSATAATSPTLNIMASCSCTQDRYQVATYWNNTNILRYMTG